MSLLTRGYFIGEIVDALSDVAGQVSTRGRLGLTDLNKHAEDFFKTILNHLFSYSLKNLNAERSNAPGLDLGDEANGVAFQVTAERTSAKVNDTLAKLSAGQITAFPRIRVLMIAGKQASYTLDAAQCARVGFEVGDIWDIDDLCKRSMDLPIDVLQSLYNYVRAELARVKIELEIPDAEGNYPTNLTDYIEAIPKPKMSDLTKFNKYLEETGEGEPIEKTRATFEALSRNLAKLPRITREFLTMMIERRETERRRGIGWNDRVNVNADKLERISRYPDRDRELRVLGSYSFIYFDEADNAGESPHWRIEFPDTPHDFELPFLDFAERNDIALNRPLVSLDFSAF
ncbi:SMEK domain-containing protein [Mesorhizobium sp.]|uniref:SMEK domain-containing protein n=1 Tax=Mesorhizobium sp. TaxID=1871066 RepID=UPI000FE46D6A|nr:SMEK domain-containing protein [Mesorhizobium sp.]RWA98281.1 MAG: hypothetical protein EOQ33_27540 [Mesorhizobium sp.]